ncbi:YtxH domain-containing protein [Rhodothermus profundi]|uniref:YtxH-like protein n=1 Tax=Rhodothermus profundi TaxID=633813 RepID=A0A1M6XHD3_9BACT|nr:YtxH domain-containing protein [Rhodothermus profundi]SHL05215.1 YtxH-like protein [Rhodothermus profundi]
MRVSWPAAICAFAAGVIAGLLLAPRAGHETRRELASKARARLHGLEEQLHRLETHLQHLEQQLQALGERFRKAGEEAGWHLEKQDIARELPRMPHG